MLYIYYINVNVAKLGSKAGNFFSGKRVGEGERDRMIEGETERQRVRETQRQRDTETERHRDRETQR